MNRIAVLAVLALAGCVPPAPPPQPNVHYVVGPPYRIGKTWAYPRAEFAADQTGLAALAADRSGLTADGEIFDQEVLAAGHRTLQLPAILRVTNLENGRQILVRLNDRGPVSAARMLTLTRRAADLLQAVDGTRLRLQVQENESRQVALALEMATPAPALASAPRGDVEAQNLAPPPGVTSETGRGSVAAAPRAQALMPAAEFPLLLPETVTQVWVNPGALYIACGSFARLEYARIMNNRLAPLGARIISNPTAPRASAYRVRLGPFATVAEAETMLDRAIGAGVNDAAIIVD